MVLAVALGTSLQETQYEPERGAQVVAYFALRSPTRSVKIRKAMKLVYLADRESVARWGEPILCEPRKSLAHGPVNMTTYSYASGTRTLPAIWARYLQPRVNHALSVVPDLALDDLDELSAADLDVLDVIWRRFGWMNENVLCVWTHRAENLPEWRKPDGANHPITLVGMMTALGISHPEERARSCEAARPLAHLAARPK